MAKGWSERDYFIHSDFEQTGISRRSKMSPFFAEDKSWF